MIMAGSGTTPPAKARSHHQRKRSDPKAGVAKLSVSASGRAAVPASKIASGNHIQFIRMLAHDLRNPISGILAASQCLLDDAAVFLDGPHITLLRAIESSSDLMLHLIEDLLEVAQADSERLRLRLRTTDVRKFVEKCAAIQRGRADAGNIRLNVTSDENVPRVDIDTTKLKWAFSALLANTIRSCAPGGEIGIHVAARRKNVVVVVRHTGAGAGEPRSGISKRERHQASALTVSTARLIVEGHGGTIRVDQKATPPAYTLTLPPSTAQKSDGGLKAASSGA
jgi:signal transduction histidine kinase